MFQRYVEVGRVVLINYGPDCGKIAVIVDIVDHSRVLIDGPTTDVERQVLSFKRMTLTPIKVDNVPRATGTVYLKSLLTNQDIWGKWQKTAWAKKMLRRKVRSTLTDFDRFRIMVAKKERRAIIGRTSLSS
ncbi:hypothetical protein SeMB42_g00135 [Synchytrium endobioticum]|uniref:Large ribosomal subunit protein eL14 domain-containing protein n=1 Tax=Synchytrium endobioticum TaxID=286115 RepID=A0A507DJ04_9FUNG|nr:hypothetical protein SeLEV6574_g00230 [Synchytrium endobioticum]TPX51583.1 hypothetical protein SeLEV6574_g00234 [Synchytrium endobioticum]TPX51616.1 hypothetical protein SeLEV6574_g00228 [Synchytrium endobioticum]TPX54873.1 hypothetical protein SeMB42_g00135 [Synchytrium endobioticum]